MPNTHPIFGQSTFVLCQVVEIKVFFPADCSLVFCMTFHRSFDASEVSSFCHVQPDVSCPTLTVAVIKGLQLGTVIPLESDLRYLSFDFLTVIGST